jgi:cytochrome c biogenesis protein CcdA
MLRRMRALAGSDRPLPVVLGATGALAVGVSLLETPCTIGLPIMWTNLLTQHEVPAAGAVALFLVYLAAFLVDELLLFAGVVVTMRAVKLQERHGRELKLVSGVVMVTLAVVMVLRPDLMESVGGALAVFGVASAIVVAVLAAGRLAVRPTRALR